jgi:hypothetical protein
MRRALQKWDEISQNYNLYWQQHEMTSDKPIYLMVSGMRVMKDAAAVMKGVM